jgi:signal peptidase I
MSRTATRPEPKAKPKPTEEPAAAKPKETFRDFVEQVVVAIILAILIRGFDAEAFVIPTGSMAPTLMGQHKEVNCPQCGYVYAINSSEETEMFTRERALKDIGVCVNCRYKTTLEDAPSFKGDRILVMKFPYELPLLPGSGGPNRWDVVVFHFPEKPETNYIKRLVGLPGEELRINHGDLQTRPAASGPGAPFQIERKPLLHQRAMQMMVYDDTHRAKLLADKPEWNRWKTLEGAKEAEPGQFTVANSPPDGWAGIRYRHLVPDPEQWKSIESGETPRKAPRPSLITDFYSYNTNVDAIAFGDLWLQLNAGYLQPNWVGDLTLECTVDVKAAGGKARFELIEAGVSNRCVVDLATGRAELFHGDAKLGEASTQLKGVGSHSVGFANVDDRLTLWVDGATPFGEGLGFDDGPGVPYVPGPKDLDPAGVEFQGASATVSDLVLKRDIYYTQDPRDPDYRIPGVHQGVDRDDPNEFGRVQKLFDFLSDPAKFAVLGELKPTEPYAIRPDHFMMMGDNSPKSSDSRAWESRDYAWRVADRSNWEVPRSLLIGKAFFVYWPHVKPFWPDIRVFGNLRFPFRPYFERMKWIR